MHIPNASILEIVKDKATITITYKYEIIYGFRLAYLHLPFTNFKGQGHGHLHSDEEYIGNGGS